MRDFRPSFRRVETIAPKLFQTLKRAGGVRFRAFRVATEQAVDITDTTASRGPIPSGGSGCRIRG